MGNRITTSILLFIIAALSFIGFLLHMIFFWLPYDEMFLFHRVVLNTTALLCFFCGLLILLDTSPKEDSRFETRFLFLILFIILILLMLLAFVGFVLGWGVNEIADGMEMTEVMENFEKTIVIALLAVSVGVIILLLIVIILNCIIIVREWGELPYDS